MKHPSTPTTTLLQLVETVSSHTRDDVETLQVMGRLLNRHSFVLAGDATRPDIFEDRLASLPAPH